MPEYYFGGEIFTTEEVVIFVVTFFLIVSFVLGLVIYLGNKLIRKHRPGYKRVGIVRGVVLAAVIIGLLALIFGVLPTVLKDNQWRNTQEKCAEKTGYTVTELDDGRTNGIANSEYRECLSL